MGDCERRSHEENAPRVLERRDSEPHHADLPENTVDKALNDAKTESLAYLSTYFGRGINNKARSLMRTFSGGVNPVRPSAEAEARREHGIRDPRSTRLNLMGGISKPGAVRRALQSKTDVDPQQRYSDLT